MKHQGLFATFLKDLVNLNASRLTLLDESAEVIKRFLRSSGWEPKIVGFASQGSWAHQTIIRPINGKPFDADLLVRVEAVETWEARDYINGLKAMFRASSTYSDKTSSCSHCITINYADDRMIDVAPVVVDRVGLGSEEVCNRTSNDFEETAPKGYTDWFNQKNGYSGLNSFRKVTRLIKYLRDNKRTFTCPSVLLTTLLGNQINFWDKDTLAFADTPTSLQTIMGRLDDFLQANEVKPRIENPSLASQDFADLWDDEEYANFRDFVHKYRGWVDEAIVEQDLDASITAWQRIFGDGFGKGVTRVAKSMIEATLSVSALLRAGAAHSDRLVEIVRDFGTSILPISFRRPQHLQEPQWPKANTPQFQVFVSAAYHSRKRAPVGRAVASGEVLPAHGGLWLEARLHAGSPIPASCRVQWRITNTGSIAMAINQGRGGFYAPDEGSRRWEGLSYRGVHMAEAFVIRREDDVILAQSDPFYVTIL